MVVLGAHTTGTAIAIAARRAGYGVIICDAADPPWTRRGRSFTNAWYVGNAEVDCEPAVLRNVAPEGLLTVGVGRSGAGLHLRVAVEADDETNLFCVKAVVPGRFATARRIGDRVVAGETVGAIGSATVISPRSGVLLGLAARGARLAAGQTVVEVDPAGDPARCFVLDARSRAVAARVIAAVAEVAPPEPRR
jgi:hypothetical protein